MKLFLALAFAAGASKQPFNMGAPAVLKHHRSLFGEANPSKLKPMFRIDKILVGAHRVADAAL